MDSYIKLIQIIAFWGLVLFFLIRWWRGENTPKLSVTISNLNLIIKNSQRYLLLDIKLKNPGTINIYIRNIRIDIIDAISDKQIFAIDGDRCLTALYLEARKKRKFKKYKYYNLENGNELMRSGYFKIEHKSDLYLIRVTVYGTSRFALQTSEWRASSFFYDMKSP